MTRDDGVCTARVVLGECALAAVVAEMEKALAPCRLCGNSGTLTDGSGAGAAHPCPNGCPEGEHYIDFTNRIRAAQEGNT